MPLRAYIEDKEIVSIDLNDEEWSALKARLKAKEIVLTLPCCGQEGFLRTSNRGLKHFVHLKSANPCDWKPESAEHLKAKVAIMEACREQGWNAIPEFPKRIGGRMFWLYREARGSLSRFNGAGRLMKQPASGRNGIRHRT